MCRMKALATIALALGFAWFGTAFAAPRDAHGGHDASLEMKLDNGQKWHTDEALRKGMTEIRAAVSAAVPRIHDGRFSKAEFLGLAESVQEQVDYMVSNCKLPEEADLQLHVVLARMLDGIAALKGDAGQEQGAVRVIQALNAYGEHFDHPGWMPVGH